MKFASLVPKGNFTGLARIKGLFIHEFHELTLIKPKISGLNPGVMTGVADGLVVDFDTNGIWKYNSSSWSKLSNLDAENIDDVDLN